MTAVVLAPECMVQLVDMITARLRGSAIPGPAAPLGRLLKSSEVMELLGYKDRTTFFAAVREAGCPMLKVNGRKFLFDELEVKAWLARRAGTHNPMQVIIESDPPRRRRAA